MNRKISLLFILACSVLPLFAKKAVVKQDDCIMTITYTDSGCPGDAIFVKAKIRKTGFEGIEKSEPAFVSAKLYLSLNGKVSRKADFYVVPQETDPYSGYMTLMAGIPLSQWWSSKGDWNLKMTYAIDQEKALEVTLPWEMKEKVFPNEDVYLDAKNTSIRTDNSKQRAVQIEKLNAILATRNDDSVFSIQPFTVPHPTNRHTAYFGDRRTYRYSNGTSATSPHYGNDYGVPEGSDVKSCADGKVVLAEWRNSTGWSVVVEHLPGLYSLYYHMSKLLVEEGQMVEQGALLGLSGSTGLATGPHLHWEMRLNQEAISPDFFLTEFNKLFEE